MLFLDFVYWQVANSVVFCPFSADQYTKPAIFSLFVVGRYTKQGIFSLFVVSSILKTRPVIKPALYILNNSFFSSNALCLGQFRKRHADLVLFERYCTVAVLKSTIHRTIFHTVIILLLCLGNLGF